MTMEVISIDTEYLTLTQFLKHINLIASGGQAKYFLAEIEVFVNGVLEDRRGKKLYAGDIIKVEGLEYTIKCI